MSQLFKFENATCVLISLYEMLLPIEAQLILKEFNYC